MEIVKRYLNNLQYYPQVKNKIMIFWHHTAGTSADGAISWWNQTPEKVGTAYVIDRDGKIIETFEPNRWAYHLGVKGDDDVADKDSIGIELVAVGQLYKEGAEFVFYPLFPSKVGRKVIPTNEVAILDTPWKGFKYYQKYTDKQIESLIWLTKKLQKDFNIPTQVDFKNFFEYNKDVITAGIHTPGIWSHTTVRQDKNDVVPYPEFLKRVCDAFESTPEMKPITSMNTSYKGKPRR